MTEQIATYAGPSDLNIAYQTFGDANNRNAARRGRRLTNDRWRL